MKYDLQRPEGPLLKPKSDLRTSLVVSMVIYAVVVPVFLGIVSFGHSIADINLSFPPLTPHQAFLAYSQWIGGVLLMYFLYRSIGKHWDKSGKAAKACMVVLCLPCFALAIYVLFYVFAVIVAVLFIVAIIPLVLIALIGLGGALGRSNAAEQEEIRGIIRDGNIDSVRRSLDDIKKKL